MTPAASLDLPTTYVCYDLETTGLRATDQIIEIGAVRVIDRYEDERFDTLVALEPGAHIDPGAARVNHISEDMLAGAPTLARAYGAFADFVGDLPLVGQNIQRFDNRYLDRAASSAQEPLVTRNGSYDTMLLYRRMVGSPADLASICAHYGVQNERAHRAWADARATSDCYLALLRDIASRAVDLERLAAEPEEHDLAGETLCFTGNSYACPKNVCEAIARHHGARVAKRMGRHVTALVRLEPIESASVRRARELGCPVVTGEEFLDRLGIAPADLRR